MEQRTVLIAGYFFLAFWIISTIVHFYVGTPAAVFWFCNLSVALLAIACFERSTTLMYFILAPAIIIQLPIMIDWAIFLSFGYSFFSLNSYYAGSPLYFVILTFARHFITVPLGIALLAFYFKPRLLSRQFALGLLVSTLVILAISWLLPKSDNINCVHRPCFASLNVLGGLYPVGWTVIVSCLVIASLFLIIIPIHWWLYIKLRRNI